MTIDTRKQGRPCIIVTLRICFLLSLLVRLRMNQRLPLRVVGEYFPSPSGRISSTRVASHLRVFLLHCGLQQFSFSLHLVEQGHHRSEPLPPRRVSVSLPAIPASECTKPAPPPIYLRFRPIVPFLRCQCIFVL